MRHRLVTCRHQAESLYEEFRAVFLFGTLQNRPSLPWKNMHNRMSVEICRTEISGLGIQLKQCHSCIRILGGSPHF